MPQVFRARIWRRAENFNEDKALKLFHVVKEFFASPLQTTENNSFYPFILKLLRFLKQNGRTLEAKIDRPGFTINIS